jgi:poly(A) polymerase
MIEQGIFRPVLPEISDAAPLARLVVRESAQTVLPDPVRRLAALLPADAKRVEDVGARLKLSNAQRKRLVTAAKRDEGADAANLEALAYRIGIESATDRLLLGTGDATKLVGWVPPVLPISGGTIVARGVKAGPEVARILHLVEQLWVAEGFPDAARVETILADVLLSQA